MIAIAAVDECWGIGYKDELLFSIPEDMKHFKELTEHKVVVMGYNTFKSLPGAKPLKNRVNIVLSRNEELELESVIVCNSIDKLFNIISTYNTDDVIVIGGQDIYNQLFNYCTAIYITKIKTRKMADRYFPNLDLLDNWKVESKSEEKAYNELKYVFYKYINIELNSL